jgi:hypothetical protein
LLLFLSKVAKFLFLKILSYHIKELIVDSLILSLVVLEVIIPYKTYKPKNCQSTVFCPPKFCDIKNLMIFFSQKGESSQIYTRENKKNPQKFLNFFIGEKNC